MTTDENPAGESHLPMLSDNMLSDNMLSDNMLSDNMLSDNMLSDNMLSDNMLSDTILQTGTMGSEGLHTTESGRMLLKYVVRCALPASQTVYTVHDGITYEFHGRFGFAPGWMNAPLINVHEQRAVTACLLSHANHYTVSIPLSARGLGLATSDDEYDRYITYDGSFYGNLFASEPVVYACSGDTAPDFNVAYPNHNTEVGDRLFRRCTDVETPGDKNTLCGFEYVGACSDACDVSSADGHTQCWSGAARTGTKYSQTMSIFVLAYDDPDSVWPELYPTVFGP